MYHVIFHLKIILSYLITMASRVKGSFQQLTSGPLQGRFQLLKMSGL